MKKTISAVIALLVCALTFTAASALEAGDTVTFGSYPQGAGGEVMPIEWTVLEVNDGYCVLISACGLDAVKYNESYADTTWEDSSVRAWLNGEFLETAFTEDERARIKTDIVVNESGMFPTFAGYDTMDAVYLLSAQEARTYFASDDDRICPLTDHAKARGAYASEGYEKDGRAAGVWWLRTPGANQDSAAAVNYDGAVYDSGSAVDDNENAARPVIRVSFD